MGPHGWMEKALCTQTDPEVFFPEGPSNTLHVKRKLAKAICGWCPVRERCLEFAISVPWIEDGIWAGFEAAEIRRMARERKRRTA